MNENLYKQQNLSIMEDKKVKKKPYLVALKNGREIGCLYPRDQVKHTYAETISHKYTIKYSIL